MENRMYADRPCAEGHHEHGFKFLLPLLFVPVVIGMMRGIGRHKFAHMQRMHGVDGENFVPPFFAEMHRRAHAAEARAQQPTTPTAEA